MQQIKTIILLVSLFAGRQNLFAQSLAINTDGSTANASALLDVKSTAKGMLIPRMSSIQRTAIAAPAGGLLVYDVDSLAFSYYNGTVWTFLKADADTSKGWSTKGNSGTTSSNFIGTTDNIDLIFKRNNLRAGLIGTTNTAYGQNALNPLTTGTFNTANGVDALTANTTGDYNTANGGFALASNTAGNYNTANGGFALFNNIAGNFNTANGLNALSSNTTGYSNVAVGISALYSNTNRSNLVAIGDSALYKNGIGAVFPYHSTYNTAVGSKALYNNTTGYYNTANGASALYASTTGNNNTANGVSALGANTTGYYNTANGRSALTLNTIGNSNTADGAEALYNNTTGYSNIAIGKSALYNNTTQNNIVAIGDSALYNNGVGANTFEAKENTAVGSKVLYSNTLGTFNTGLGYRALYANTTGNSNIAIGSNAVQANTTGTDNLGIGGYALGYNLISNNHSAIGLGAMLSHYKNDSSVAVGNYSLQFDTTGFGNVAVGVSALMTARNSNKSTALGTRAGFGIDNGTQNLFLGYNATTSIINNVTNNSAIGANAYVTSNNSMVLGGINGQNGATADTKVGIGVTNPTEKLEIGNGRLRFRGFPGAGSAHGITWTNNAGTIDRAFIGMETDDLIGIYNFGLGAWNVRVHNTTGEMGINKQPGTTLDDSRLQVKQRSASALRGIGIETAINTNRWDMWVDNNAAPDYNFNYNGTLRGYIQNATGNYIVVSDRRFKKDVTDFLGSLSTLNQLKTYQYHYADNSAADPLSIGFMAQDVQKIFPGAVSEKTMDDGNKRLGINYQYFTVLAIKGIQEQQLIIENQNKKIENLQMQIDEIKKLIKKD